jgi:hypothetical protein
MKRHLTAEYRWEAARLRALIADATTARARECLEVQIRLNERLAKGKSKPTKVASQQLEKAA